MNSTINKAFATIFAKMLINDQSLNGAEKREISHLLRVSQSPDCDQALMLSEFTKLADYMEENFNSLSSFHVMDNRPEGATHMNKGSGWFYKKVVIQGAGIFQWHQYKPSTGEWEVVIDPPVYNFVELN